MADEIITHKLGGELKQKDFLMTDGQRILDFWREIGPKGWWRKNEDIDNQIIQEFSELHAKAVTGELSDWENDPDDCLALVILLDQFSRNMFRGDPATFAQDEQGLAVARRGIAKGHDKKADDNLASFFYLPFMHSEILEDQEECVRIFEAIDKPENLKAAVEHHDIIKQFGRFPHRNEVLGRETSKQEQAFLDDGGFKG